MGLFPLSELHRKAPPTLIPRCGVCKLYKSCNSPKMPVSGKGRRKILIIGEAPGKNEDEQNRQFVGNAGDKLWEKLNRLGVERGDCWITNALICHPKDEDGHNRTPTSKEIGYCRPNLIRTVQELQPELILPLGGVAVTSLVGWLWREDPGSIKRWLGWRIPCQSLNAWICPNWHPSYLLYDKAGAQNEVVERLFEGYFARALKLKGRPWDNVPDYLSQVQCIYNPAEAARRIREFKNVAAIDFETNTLKPDAAHTKIVSCAISDGRVTIAYPWCGEAVQATKEFLEDASIEKIAANMKFELRWTLRHMGIFIQNMRFDTMLATHALDNRGGICSLKFQAFVTLGVSSYDDHIAPFFEGNKEEGGNAINRIHEIKLSDLLKYNGADALLEYLLAMKQTRQLGIELGV